MLLGRSVSKQGLDVTSLKKQLDGPHLWPVTLELRLCWPRVPQTPSSTIPGAPRRRSPDLCLWTVSPDIQLSLLWGPVGADDDRLALGRGHGLLFSWGSGEIGGSEQTVTLLLQQAWLVPEPRAATLMLRPYPKFPPHLQQGLLKPHTPQNPVGICRPPSPAPVPQAG